MPHVWGSPIENDDVFVAPGVAFKVPEAPGGFRPAVALRRAAEVHLYLGDGMMEMEIYLRFVEGS